MGLSGMLSGIGSALSGAGIGSRKDSVGSTALRPDVDKELAALRAAGDLQGEVRRLDELLARSNKVSEFGRMGLPPDVLAVRRAEAVALLSKQVEASDPFSAMIKDAALAQLRRRTGSRAASFSTGPRGLEGPMSNMIFGKSGG